MVLLIQLTLGAVMIGLTVIVHAVGLDFIIRHTPSLEKPFRKFSKRFWQAMITSAVVVCVFFIHIIAIWLWTLLYLLMQCNPLGGFEESLYFATVTYSTLGYGDIVVEPSCRMLSGIEGANGFILFSWTAAFIFEVVSRIYRREAGSL
jgi:hypothetical protein